MPCRWRLRKLVLAPLALARWIGRARHRRARPARRSARPRRLQLVACWPNMCRRSAGDGRRKVDHTAIDLIAAFGRFICASGRFDAYMAASSAIPAVWLNRVRIVHGRLLISLIDSHRRTFGVRWLGSRSSRRILIEVGRLTLINMDDALVLSDLQRFGANAVRCETQKSSPVCGGGGRADVFTLLLFGARGGSGAALASSVPRHCLQKAGASSTPQDSHRL